MPLRLQPLSSRLSLASLRRPADWVSLWQELPGGLRNALLLTLVLSGLCLLLLPPAEQDAAADPAPRVAREPAAASLQTAEPVWQALARSELALREPAEADPFRSGASKPSAIEAPKRVDMAPPADAFVGPPLRPPPPEPPLPKIRVAGWLRGADGTLQILLNQGGADLVAQPGLLLADGFVLQSIGPTTLLLFHPATGSRHTLDLPATLSTNPPPPRP